MTSASERYNRTAQALHWLIAALVIANLLIGLFHGAFEGVVRLIPVHKSIGLTVLALTVIRILWRLTWTHPPFPDSVTRAEAAAARGVQGTFYGLMLAMPLTGWVMASAGKYPLTWFGLIDIPKFAVTQTDPAYLVGRTAHEVLGWLFAGLAVLHIAAALRHHFILRDRVFRRMLV
jgi:cytochrome b561